MTSIFDILIASTERTKENLIFYFQTKNNRKSAISREFISRDLDEIIVHASRIENNFLRKKIIEELKLILDMPTKKKLADYLIVFDNLVALLSNHQVYVNMYPNE